MSACDIWRWLVFSLTGRVPGQSRQPVERRVVGAEEAAGLGLTADFVDTYTNPALIGSETGGSDCGATAITADMTFGPCIKCEQHKDWHEDVNGTRWTSRCQDCGRTEREGCGCPTDQINPEEAT